MFDVIFLAIALSMDAFAVSISLGAMHARPPMQMALLAACYFGLAQGIMPLLGYVGGLGLLGFVADYSHWIAFFMLLFIGGKMIFEALSTNTENAVKDVTHRILIVLAIATSIDAMAAGFTLNLMDFNAFIACLLIAFITFLFSAAGVAIGHKTGAWLEKKAEVFGGVILILIGFKLLLF